MLSFRVPRPAPAPRPIRRGARGASQATARTAARTGRRAHSPRPGDLRVEVTGEAFGELQSRFELGQEGPLVGVIGVDGHARREVDLGTLFAIPRETGDLRGEAGSASRRR